MKPPLRNRALEIEREFEDWEAQQFKVNAIVISVLVISVLGAIGMIYLLKAKL